MTFDELFKQATGNRNPYPYQMRFATGGTLPQLLSVPTGVGKTATAILGWLWRRRFAEKAIKTETPRRLVYCLPMRTLVEQTRDECLKWRKNLELSGEDVGVHILMGGEDASDWDEHPERDAIIIGTQDMLLSRALNRGYGMSRYRWPMQFGLLNNDCLWVMDETQSMGVGLTTSAQLAGLRSKLHTYGTCHTLWMSATLNNEALQTVDHPQPDTETAGLTLNDDDRGNTRVQQLLTASKTVMKADVSLSKDTEKGYEKQLAEEVQTAHQPATLTLIVINSVLRSQTLFQAVQKCYQKDENSPEIHLIHSRFRPDDRQRNQSAALNEDTIPSAGRIVIATQAIEAGVDISATTIFTELAPWASMVQRFGRCNRRGLCGIDQHPKAVVRWIDIDTSDGKRSKFTLPYQPEALNQAREAIASLEDVGPQALAGVIVNEDRPVSHVLRRKDLIDLFDTTPDLSGNDLDVSRYIRDGDDTDVQVYWREWDVKKFPNHPPIPAKKGVQLDAFQGPQREELCSVSVGRMKDFVDKLKQTSGAWAWDPLTRQWNSIGKSTVRPGMTILLHTTAGGYHIELGWTQNPKHKPNAVEFPETSTKPLDAMAEDDALGGGQPLSLTQHLKDVVHSAEELANHVFDEQIPWLSVLAAAQWHDVGKAHSAFQTAMRDFSSVSSREDAMVTLWAKAGEHGMPIYRVEYTEVMAAENSDQEPSNTFSNKSATAATAVATEPTTRVERRTGFRHELASALAWLHHVTSAETTDDDELVDLVAYLIAAHHGKVRLSIRSMPNEIGPKKRTMKFARGIWEGDSIPAVDLGNGETSTAVECVNLDLMNLGDSDSGPSWLARSLSVRDEYGPFRLAFLETLLRVADWRGSANPGVGTE